MIKLNDIKEDAIEGHHDFSPADILVLIECLVEAEKALIKNNPKDCIYDHYVFKCHCPRCKALASIRSRIDFGDSK